MNALLLLLLLLLPYANGLTMLVLSGSGGAGSEGLSKFVIGVTTTFRSLSHGFLGASTAADDDIRSFACCWDWRCLDPLKKVYLYF